MVDFIRKIVLFKGLEEPEMLLLAENMRPLTVAAGTVLFEQRDPVENLLFVVTGEVKLTQQTIATGSEPVSFLGRGNFAGEAALVDDTPHTVTAIATQDTQLLTLPLEVVKGIFAEQPHLGVKVIANAARLIARRLRQANARITGLAAQYRSMTTREEHDLLGYREVPDEYYYGIQTLRALENFPISGVPVYVFTELIEALAIVKKAAALANYELDLLPQPLTESIVQACDEIRKGRFHPHFVVDMIQGGAGTSTNMNANEVIANRALEIMGYKRGEYDHCHPNNHVNLSQSTNDVYPTAVKIALIYSNRKLVNVLGELVSAFREKADQFAHILKMGRTQLQDAVPTTLGYTFEAFAVTIEEEVEHLEANARYFLQVNMGATAIGTGINSHPDYTEKVINYLGQLTGLEVVRAANLIEETQDTGAFVTYASAVKRLAVKLSKISNDLRLLASGPRAGIGEINLPAMQPGSSIMPGKVNPVIPEVVNQIAFKVIGNDLTVTLAAEAGQLELNVMEPIMVAAIFESVQMLKHGIRVFVERCIGGITANEARCRELVENSIGLVTALVPVLGYETSSALAKEALENNRSVYALVQEKGLLTKAELDDLLRPENMIRPRRKPMEYRKEE